MKAGFDFGSKNMGVAILDNDRVIFSDSLPHNGDIAGSFQKILDRIQKVVGLKSILTYGLTGNIKIDGKRVYDPVIASVEANRYLNTYCRNIFSIGCESFYLVRLDKNFNYVNHIVNSDCASGTGGFIDQQAERLGFSTQTLAEKADEYTDKPPAIATRCAVFAKSDIIHAQAKGFSKEAICAGLCEGVARNVLSNTVQGKELPGQVLFTGGMGLNKKIVRQLSKGLKKKVQVPKQALVFNAIGAAILGEEPFDGIHDILKGIRRVTPPRQPLGIHLENYPDFDQDEHQIEDGIEITRYARLDTNATNGQDVEFKVYIGIDVGSTSTKAIVMTREKKILIGLYGRTKGDPVGAVSLLLAKLKQIFSKVNLTILGVGTTGSGRQLIYQVIKADEAINEITAHAIGATFIDPNVDTIIEIGGQDSKFTQLSNGRVTNSVMNYVCAAGTGSFIEEQAKRLSISLSDISNLARNQKAPFTSDRCTVYMERDLNLFLSEGWQKEQIIAAVLYSVRDNYLSKVVGKSLMGNHVYFQGATARNKALVAVFENELNKKISVSKYCHLTGALGCAVSLSQKQFEQTRFTGMDFSYKTQTETCNLCANQCELRVYTLGDTKTAWGLKCGREYGDKTARNSNTRSHIEQQYEKIFSATAKAPGQPEMTVGLPQALFMKEYGSLFTDFFHHLNIGVITGKSSGKQLRKGMEMMNADFCAPMALSHGMVASLNLEKIDFLFFPTIINEQNLMEVLPREIPFQEKMTDGYFCYYSSYAPSIIENLPGAKLKVPMVSPKIKFNNIDDKGVAADLAIKLEGVIHRPRKEIMEAFLAARKTFHKAREQWRQEGLKILAQPEKKMKILLLGRPYALFDQRINLGIPQKLEEMGLDLLNQSMFQDNTSTPPNHMENMHWYYGQQLLIAAEFAARNPDIYPVFLTCFRCSPDAYLITYFKEIMERAKKPYLVLQLDEHSSDVGYMTRIEAAIDTFRSDTFRSDTLSANTFKTDISKNNFSKTTGPDPFQPDPIQADQFQPDDTILIPATDKRINQFQKLVFQAAGFKALVLDLDTAMMNQGYRYASGGECLPNVAITGSLIHALGTGDIDSKKAILYLPNICLSCNFNQYANLVRVACKNAGFDGVRIMNFNGLTAVPGIGSKTNAHLLSASILGSLLEKLKRRYQPYEQALGDIQALIDQSEKLVEHHITQKKSLLTAAKEIRQLFDPIALPRERKPIIGILGDMYAKFNAVLNDDICDYVESLGGEVLLPSYNELVLHTMHADVVENGMDGRLLSTMTRYEQRFESVFKGLMDESFEPSQEECTELTTKFGLKNFIAGETAVSVGRLLYYIRHDIVDAIIHINPLLCCPGVISASLFKNIQERFNLPVIDLFYDGTNKPNKTIDPLMFYLKQSRAIGKPILIDKRPPLTVNNL